MDLCPPEHDKITPSNTEHADSWADQTFTKCKVFVYQETRMINAIPGTSIIRIHEF